VIPTRDDMVVTRWGARFRGRRIPCAIGRGGVTAAKREGDGASPAGAWRLVFGGYRPDRIAAPLSPIPLAAVGPADIWSDDATDPDYNHWLTRAGHPFSHERLRRGDRLYDLVLMSDWNWPEAVPGKGSAIFVHLWRRPRFPTAGCIAFSRPDLSWIIARWSPRSRIIVRG
jgi:L,D-peptidoglycan transpeptidase YkuD (ErfK/YbiS/YcfS/YnhG family)